MMNREREGQEGLDEQLLLELAVGDRQPTGEEIDQLLRENKSTREMWDRLQHVQSGLDQLSAEDHALLEELEAETPPAEHVHLAESWLAHRKTRRRVVQFATAATIFGIALWSQRLAPEQAPIGLMSFGGDQGLTQLQAEERGDGRLILRWQHEEQFRARAYTTYRLSVYGENARLLTEQEVEADTQLVLTPEANWPRDLTWRVIALDAEQVEYAAGSSPLRRTP